MRGTSDDEAWWLSATVTGGMASGLRSAEAQARLARFGRNEIRPHARLSALRQLLRRFANPLVLLLLIASAVSALSGELANFAIISCIVLFSVMLDFVQEYRAEAAAAALRQTVAIRATALRDGTPHEIAVSDLVPGDVVQLSAGDIVPADAVLIEARDFFVNQSLLTGESFPVEKHVAPPGPQADSLQDASNAVFMGTSVVGGSARALIVRTGGNTAIGRIADTVSKPTAQTAFELGTRRFGMLIMQITFAMVLFVLLVNAWQHRPWLESFLFAVALAVGLTPELLPMVVSVTLARGALRLARLRMIVKRQSAIQDLGSMDVLCTDKTGTLTEASIRLERCETVTGAPSDQVLQLAWLNSHFETGLKSPIDEALLRETPLHPGAWRKIDEIPFDFERRRVSVLVDDGAQRWLVAKGAAEDMVKMCAWVQTQDGMPPEPIDEAMRARIRERYLALEADGLRVLGVAWREVPAGHDHARLDDETQMTLAGFASFIDPPKASAADALRRLQAAGLAIKVVTGDSELVTRHVCTRLGIEVQRVLTGQEIAQIDDATLRQRVSEANLFCRVNPGQKQRVILALKAAGHVVGYMGDGINDAPSLHAADVGLSVDSAVDVAKAAADIIVLEKNLQVLHDGVMEGRRTFANIMKYILMGTSSNFGNMFSMAAAAMFLPFLPMLPTQILLNNMLYDLSEVAIPFDEVDAEDTRWPHALDLHYIRGFMLAIGPISSVFDLVTFWVLLHWLQAHEALFQTGWFIESLCTQVLVIFVIRTRRNPLASRPHRLLVATSLAVVAVALTLPWWPVAASLGFVPPPPALYAVVALMSLGYLVTVELAKRCFHRWWMMHGSSN